MYDGINPYNHSTILLSFKCIMNVRISNAVSCYFLFVYFLLDLSCGECNVKYLYYLCCSVNGSDWLVSCVSDSVSELFGNTARNIIGCGCYFVVECYGSVLLDNPCMIQQRVCVFCM